MRDRRLMLLLSLMALLVVTPAASASEGCVAPQGTAAIDQYCEMLPTVEGPTDATGRETLPLASVLPKRMVKQLERAGILGQALLALPSAAGGGPGAMDATAAERMSARRARSDPRLEALLPGQGTSASSVLDAAGELGSQVEQGFAWTLVMTLLGLAGLSVWGSLRGWSVT
jgi:hypothetical protein